MTLKFTISGKDINSMIHDVALKLKSCGKVIQDTLLKTTRDHVSKKYPNSRHWDPHKIVDSGFTDGDNPSGSINIFVPGSTRAYHKVDIYPIRARRLTIPIHTSAYHHRAKDFDDLFYIKKKNLKEFLARKNGSELAFMYFLAKEVHQKQDPSLLPSDEAYANAITRSITAYVQAL